MPTPVYFTNWSHKAHPTLNGGGIYSTQNGSVMSIDTSILSPQALKCVTSASLGYVGYNQVSGSATLVGRVYVYFPTALPSSSVQFLIGNGSSSVFHNIRYNSSTGRLEVGNSSLWTTGPIISANTLYRIDFRMICSGTTHTVDWQVDGVAQTQWSLSGQSNATWSSFRLGSQNSSTATILFQHLVLSITGADYPIGPGGTEALFTTSDGTHNAGTNVMEDNAGVDIGVTPAYNKLDTMPPGSSEYIKQVAIGAGNYVEVNFADLTASFSAIIGAMGILASGAENTSQQNRGACYISKDNFSTSTTILGSAASTSSYISGTLADLNWRSAIISGAVDLSTINALKARMGHSGDVTPNPYWVGLLVEVAYTTSSAPPDIELDDVVYSSTVHDVTILENIVVPLDLITYSTSLPELTILENIPIALDTATYSSAVPDLTIVENIPIPLDLVTYSTIINDISILENVVVLLDPATYFSSVLDLTILEHILLDLDLVDFSSQINDIVILENIQISLDLLVFSSEINDIDILEAEIVSLDPISYLITVHNIEVLTSEEIGLDTIIYSSTIHDITILESESLSLDLISYSTDINDLEILENIVIPLDLVSYSSSIRDLEILENLVLMLDLVSYSLTVYDIEIVESEADILLELVTYSSVVNDILLILRVETPIERVFAIEKEDRTFVIERENRIFSIDKENRII